MLIPVCFLCDSGAERGLIDGSEMFDFRIPDDCKEAETVTFNNLFKLAMDRNVGCYTFTPQVRLICPGILLLLHELWRDLSVRTIQMQHDTLLSPGKPEETLLSPGEPGRDGALQLLGCK